MVNVTWYDARDYCQWLSGVTGRGYALPSEAEWEKGARGTDEHIYPWGNRWDATLCNSGESGPDKTISVHAYPQGASPYGVLDMAGNVWEWTRSLWGPFGIPIVQRMGEKISMPPSLWTVWSGAARSTVPAGSCGVPVTRGTTRTSRRKP